MFRDTDEALKRLQAELLDEPEPADEETLLDEDTLDDLLEDKAPANATGAYQNYSNNYGRNLRNYASGYRAYNTDHTDTDLDRFSEAVREAGKKPRFPWLVALLVAGIVLMAAMVLWLYLGGILP